MKPEHFFSPNDKVRIQAAIQEAESNTSGEIRLHVEITCPTNVLDRASYMFSKLGMHKTALRNGVLFYLAIESKRFAVLGDVGINKVVPEGFWNCIADTTTEQFKKNDFATGLEAGILLCGEQLKKYFPYQIDDVNELSDEISFGK